MTTLTRTKPKFAVVPRIRAANDNHAPGGAISPQFAARLARLRAEIEANPPVAPFRLFDQESADAAGRHDAGYCDARTLYGDARARENGTIATFNDAWVLRRELADMYGCYPRKFEIHDANGQPIA